MEKNNEISFLYDDIVNDMGCSVKEALETAKIKDNSDNEKDSNE